MEKNLRNAVQSKGQYPNPTSAVMLLTHKCDMSCLHCLNNWKLGTKRKNQSTMLKLKDLTPAQKLKTIDELKNIGIQYISFSGGEPLLDENCANYIKYAKSLGIKTELQTNGIYLTQEFLDSVKGSLDRITISLHGIRRPHNKIAARNCFDQVITAIKLSKKNGFMTSTFLTLTKLNVRTLDKYIYLVNKLKVDTAYFTRLYNAGDAVRNQRKIHLSKEQYVEALKTIDITNRAIVLGDVKGLANQTHKTRLVLRGSPPLCLLKNNQINLLNSQCSAAKTEIAINPNGDILPCPSWHDALGNIQDNSLNHIWQSPAMRAVASFRPEKCSSCMLTACSRGCQLCMKDKVDEYADIKNELKLDTFYKPINSYYSSNKRQYTGTT